MGILDRLAKGGGAIPPEDYQHSSLLGNKALLAVAAGLGAKLLSDRAKRR